ncbi:hypothetical protein [Polaromonas sp.]|uniref:hypothetical protein n=1 Tax=Polaromonas sp. TaxID=1869339 RepID=UPI003266F7BD
MSTPTLLGPRGTPMVELGGERAWRQFTKGDMIASLQWLDLQAVDPNFPEAGAVPCMCVFHAHRRVETGAHVIPQRFAYLYGAREGKPTPYFFSSVMNACETAGFDRNDKAAQHRIMDLVLDAMPDLILMPGEQPSALELKARRQGIEATVTINGRKAHEERI